MKMYDEIRELLWMLVLRNCPLVSMFILKERMQFLFGRPACVDCHVRVVCKGCAALCELI